MMTTNSDAWPYPQMGATAAKLLFAPVFVLFKLVVSTSAIDHCPESLIYLRGDPLCVEWDVKLFAHIQGLVFHSHSRPFPQAAVPVSRSCEARFRSCPVPVNLGPAVLVPTPRSVAEHILSPDDINDDDKIKIYISCANIGVCTGELWATPPPRILADPMGWLTLFIH